MSFPNPAMDAIVARAAVQLTALERIHDELSGLSVTGRADGGRVVVRIDSAGGLAGLSLQPGAGGGDSGRLARLIVDAAAAAARELDGRRADLTAGFLDEFADTPTGAGTGSATDASNPYAPDPEAPNDRGDR